MPSGIPYIITNEAAERFSFYGMKGILVIFMTKFMLDSSGNPDLMGEEEARQWYHTFTSAVYFFPLIGALIADAFLGKYKTILILSVVYCLGHFALALDDTRIGLSVGLALIAIGSGGIKPCVSAHVGDQFGKSNHNLLEKVFGWFYFSINFGAFLSTMLTPWLLNDPRFGPHWAFGVPGGLMLLATIFFWMGRNVFIHIPPGGMAFLRETFSREGLGSIARLFIIYAFVAMFWALFDQTGSAWVQQADRMDRNFLGFQWLPSQIQAINPIMIMVLIPIFNGVKAIKYPGLYNMLGRVWTLTPLRKIGVGFFLTVPAFLIPAWIEAQLDAGVAVNISWQLAAYVIMTAAEVFVSITCLEFSYTQAPKKMKSLVMACFLLSVSIGNVFVSGVNYFIQNDPPSFQVDVPGEYVMELAADDGTATTTDVVTIIAMPGERPEEEASSPTPATLAVETRPDFAILPGRDVWVGGQASAPDNQRPELSWQVVSVPTTSQVGSEDLNYASQQRAWFRADVEGTYVLSLTASFDGQRVSDNIEVTVTDQNFAPITIAGDDVTLYLQTDPVAVLNGSASRDPNGDALTYAWTLRSAPPESAQSVITNADQPTKTTKLEGALYYLFFSLCMLITSLLFIPVSLTYKEKTYIQDEVAGAEQPS